MRILLPFLLLPLFAPAQQVEPILSDEYLSLVRQDSLKKKKKTTPDTVNSARNTYLRSLHSYNGYAVKKIVIKKGGLHIEPASSKVLLIGGHLTISTDIKNSNSRPALQNMFVQGRSINNATAWRGPETGELFSYGPPLHSLEYDNSTYPYDVNGRLVPAGSGQGKKANAYSSSIFRTAVSFNQSLLTYGRYMVKGKQVASGSLKFSRGNEQLFIRHNENSNHDFTASVETAIKKLIVGGGYSSLREKYSNSNRNGFLNRVYQNSLLTPVSFDNTQGTNWGNIQRSYSLMADNPFFLLEDNGNSFSGTQRRGNLNLGITQGKFKARISHSVEEIQQHARETYKPGLASYPDGIATNRQTRDNNYSLKTNITRSFGFTDYALKSNLGLNHIFSSNRSVIAYHPGNRYEYQRSSHDVSLAYQATYDKHEMDAGLNIVNKMYASNTTKSDFFLPGISGYVWLYDIFHCNRLDMKIAGSLDYFNSELSVNRSFSQNNLLRYSTQQVFQYFPVTELPGFGSLSPIRNKDWVTSIDLHYGNKISLYAELFSRVTTDDVFMVYENGAPVLKNIASHRNNGVELLLTLEPYLWNRGKLGARSTISFLSYRSKVTNVAPGYDYTPIAGFSNVHKAIVKGKPLGVITGNSFAKDSRGTTVIGSDGFPVANTARTVIGNPIPDFVMKMHHQLTWKKWLLTLDWEWKKGGQVWNGTQAILDYYGRSAGSGELRNTTNFVFPGVTQDGHQNDKPVSFYDPGLPVENNRWTRYGHGGIAEEYIQKGDHVRINNIGFSYKVNFRKHVRSLLFSLYANNLIIWTPYKGADPNQLLFDQPGTSGLDFFNLPSLKTFGFSVSTQF